MTQVNDVAAEARDAQASTSTGALEMRRRSMEKANEAEALMKQALALLDEVDEWLAAVRLQHAIDSIGKP